jgi:hypothetical protein
MNTVTKKEENEKDDHKKEVTIFVNAEEKPWNEKEISFEQVIVLAFGTYENNEAITYTVTYKKGIDKKPEGSLTKGQSIHVKDKMRFNATRTNKS